MTCPRCGVFLIVVALYGVGGSFGGVTVCCRGDASGILEMKIPFFLAPPRLKTIQLVWLIVVPL